MVDWLSRLWFCRRFRQALVAIVLFGVPIFLGVLFCSFNLFLGGATVAAIAVALLRDDILNWISPPLLTVSYVHGPCYCDTPLFRPSDGNPTVVADSYYFSLRIHNKATRNAKNVEVFADELHRVDNGERIRRFSLRLKWAYLVESRLETLAPGMERFCNIGYIIDPQQRGKFANEDIPGDDGMPADTTLFSLDLEAKPHHLIHLLKPGKYALSLIVVAVNHAPIRKSIEINLKGRWFANDMTKMLSDGVEIGLM
jgi:hypothetical protein